MLALNELPTDARAPVIEHGPNWARGVPERFRELWAHFGERGGAIRPLDGTQEIDRNHATTEKHPFRGLENGALADDATNAEEGLSEAVSCASTFGFIPKEITKELPRDGGMHQRQEGEEHTGFLA
jgi:hypothetical protein